MLETRAKPWIWVTWKKTLSLFFNTGEWHWHPEVKEVCASVASSG
jgi:hypothetical protein